MKGLSKLKQNSGFTLSECLIALAVFAILMMILMQTMAFSVTQRTQNNRNVTDLNEQVEIVASGDFSRFDSAGSNTLSADNIVFYEDDGSGNADLTKKVAEIDGDALGHFDNSATLRITSPEFATDWNEFDVILADWDDAVEEIDPNRLYSSIELTATVSGADSPWQVTLSGYTVPSSNYVIYLLLPTTADPLKVSITDLKNCSGRVITGDEKTDRSAVRITNLVPGSDEAKMTISF